MPYTRPFRLRVLDGLTECLQRITQANGYTSDLSQSVFRGRAVYGPDDPLPMVSILETPVPVDIFPSPDGALSQHGDWDILLQGFVRDDPENPTDPAYFLIAEVKKALAQEGQQASRQTIHGGNNIFGMGGKVISIDVGPGTVRPADDVSATAYFWLRVTLKIVEDMTKPFD
jgi:hypothetical protein